MGKWSRRSTDTVDGADITSLIGEGTTFNGELILKGGARIDGKVTGRITAQSLLVVGPTGDVDAEELRATSLAVCGSVRGKLVVKERLEIQAGGRVNGHVVMQMEKDGLIVAPGGIFEGTVEYSKDSERDASLTREFAVPASV
jgi:cytoskeletal protein CcmA (bactofilin family)